MLTDASRCDWSSPRCTTWASGGMRTKVPWPFARLATSHSSVNSTELDSIRTLSFGFFPHFAIRNASCSLTLELLRLVKPQELLNVDDHTCTLIDGFGCNLPVASQEIAAC